MKHCICPLFPLPWSEINFRVGHNLCCHGNPKICGFWEKLWFWWFSVPCCSHTQYPSNTCDMQNDWATLALSNKTLFIKIFDRERDKTTCQKWGILGKNPKMLKISKSENLLKTCHIPSWFTISFIWLIFIIVQLLSVQTVILGFWFVHTPLSTVQWLERYCIVQADPHSSSRRHNGPGSRTGKCRRTISVKINSCKRLWDCYCRLFNNGTS